MAIDTWHDLGPVAGGCTMCGNHGRLLLGEYRSRPDLRDRLRGRRSEPTSRLVSCQSCGWRWTVRLTDDAAAASAVIATRAAAAEAERLRGAVGAHRDRRKSDRPSLQEAVPFAVEPAPVPWPRTCPRRESLTSAR